jgi:hypothetical protein
MKERDQAQQPTCIESDEEKDRKQRFKKGGHIDGMKSRLLRTHNVRGISAGIAISKSLGPRHLHVSGLLTEHRAFAYIEPNFGAVDGSETLERARPQKKGIHVNG